MTDEYAVGHYFKRFLALESSMPPWITIAAALRRPRPSKIEASTHDELEHHTSVSITRRKRDGEAKQPRGRY